MYNILFYEQYYILYMKFYSSIHILPHTKTVYICKNVFTVYINTNYIKDATSFPLKFALF